MLIANKYLLYNNWNNGTLVLLTKSNLGNNPTYVYYTSIH